MAVCITAEPDAAQFRDHACEIEAAIIPPALYAEVAGPLCGLDLRRLQTLYWRARLVR
jgi:hypothetical protein